MAILVIDPGQFRARLTVEKDTITRNDDATVSHSWAAQTPNPIRAKIERLTGTEYVEAQALAAGATLRLKLRYFPGLEPVLYRFKRYGTSEVLSPLQVNDHEERGIYMIVFCGENLA